MKGELNSMQKSMVRWNEMHPYSAVHVARVRGALALPCLRSAIDTTLNQWQLSRLELDSRRFTFEYQNAPANCQLHALADDAKPWSAVVAEIERQLNLPFEHAAPFTPFRFLVAQAKDSFYLGLIYFHPAADAESIVWLLRDIVTRYRKGDAWELKEPPNLYPDSRAHLLRRHLLLLVRKVLTLPVQSRNLRHSYRAPCRAPGDLTNGFAFFSLEPHELRSLVAASKSWNVTVNDLLMAVLMKSLGPCSPARAQARKRRKLSIGCIVNLRKELGLDRQTFGVFLGSFTVTHEVPDGVTLRGLASDVAGQTGPIKRHRLYLASPVELDFSRFMLGLFSPARRKKFYAKHYPLWGGITNMNLNRLWTEEDGDALMDYFRGVSTGPVTPLVLSATTVGDRINFGISYRLSVFSRKDIEDLQCRFRKHVAETGITA